MTPEVAETPTAESTSTPGGWVAIVLNWNGGQETLDCLRSLRAVERHAPRVLLADNGSTDGSVEQAEAEHPRLHVLRFGENLGYAAGNNRAVRHALDELGAEWVCLLNSDVLVTPDLFERLEQAREALERAGGGPVGALGPRLLYRDRPDIVWACGGTIGPSLNVTQLREHGRAHVPAPDPPVDVDYLPGACLLVSARAIAAAGLLDESFFCYLEDADWCVRMRAAGLRTVAVPGALAWHGLSSSTGGGYSAGRKYMTGVNSVHFLRKHGTWRGWAALVLFDIALWPLAFAKAAVRGKARAAVAKLHGVMDGLRGKMVTADVAARFRRRPS